MFVSMMNRTGLGEFFFGNYLMRELKCLTFLHQNIFLQYELIVREFMF
jgi:hypothetical protein